MSGRPPKYLAFYSLKPGQAITIRPFGRETLADLQRRLAACAGWHGKRHNRTFTTRRTPDGVQLTRHT